MGADDLLILHLPARPEFVATVRDAVGDLADDLGLTAPEQDALRLAVGEACSNAAQHGSPNDLMTVRCRCDGPEFVVEVENPGDFQPTTDAVMPDSSAESGRGRALMEALTDRVEYIPSSGRTIVRLRKAICGPVRERR